MDDAGFVGATGARVISGWGTLVHLLVPEVDAPFLPQSGPGCYNGFYMGILYGDFIWGSYMADFIWPFTDGRI